MNNRISSALALLATLALSACGGGGGGGGGAAPETPPLAPGVYTLRTAGGAGGSAGGTGGDGGAVTAIKEGGSGEIAVRRGGVVDASFTPLAIAADLGTNPLVITADTTVVVSGTEPAAGAPYLRALNVDKPNLFIADGDGSLGDETPVTGISVAAGATLTFQLNDIAWARLLLTGDIENHGTITVAEVSAAQKGNLEINCRSFLGDGAVTTAGSVEGQSGGSFFLYATGDIASRGPITTAGADNTAGDGGHGGSVELYADGRIENVGAIRTAGGSATGGEGNGGAGGYIDMVGDHDLNNAGELVASGGNGYTSGGPGGSIYLEVYTQGDLRNSGSLVSAGGTAVAGGGGPGGYLGIFGYGGSLFNAADLTTTGGKATGTGGNGGAGGDIALAVFPADDLLTPPGDLLVSGNFNASGGSASGGAGYGGPGGWVDFYIGNFSETNPDLERAQRIALLGFKVIETHGGSGNKGASGGSVELIADAGYVNPSGVTNEADISSRGGSAVADGVDVPAWGGMGGDVVLWANVEPGNIANPRGSQVVNFGAIDATGGSNREFIGSNEGWEGSGGYVQLLGFDGVYNAGSISVNGGQDIGNDGWGGLGGWIDLTSGRGVTNTARLEASGGNGEYQGGDAGEIHLVAQTAIDSRGELAATGGNADPARFGSRGGAGGLVQVELAGTGSFNHTASVTVTGGSGSAPGQEGIVYLID